MASERDSDLGGQDCTEHDLLDDAHVQSATVAKSDGAGDDQAFIDHVSEAE